MSSQEPGEPAGVGTGGDEPNKYLKYAHMLFDPSAADSSSDSIPKKDFMVRYHKRRRNMSETILKLLNQFATMSDTGNTKTRQEVTTRMMAKLSSLQNQIRSDLPADHTEPLSEDDKQIFANISAIYWKLDAALRFDQERAVLAELVVNYVFGSDDDNNAGGFMNYAVVGPAGVGKTTFARLLCDFIGYLYLFENPDQVMSSATPMAKCETIRQSFVDGLFKAILFDEAYTLASQGMEATMNDLIQLMDLYKGCCALVFVFYDDNKKEQLSEANQGFSRRVAATFRLLPLTLEEIIGQVEQQLASRTGIQTLPGDSEEQLRDTLSTLYQTGYFGPSNFAGVSRVISQLDLANKVNRTLSVAAGTPNVATPLSPMQIFNATLSTVKDSSQ